MPDKPPTGPTCPRCRRRLAAWKLDHCVYCGEKFPENIREGFAEPEALKFVERPQVPTDAAKQLEMMKYVELGAKKKPSNLGRSLALLTLPVFAVIFYLIYRLVARFVPYAGLLVVALGLGLVGYVIWTIRRSSG